MIEARDFVEAARHRGFIWYAGVPCSYLTPFINYVSQDASLRYLSMTNEGDAVALIAGAALANEPTRPSRGIAMMQNSGLGNAVSPLTSLTWTFQLPQLLIVTWRGQPGVPDEPQHELMGAITPALLDTMEIAWELFPVEADALEAALNRAVKHMDESGRPYALLMQKGSVAAYPLKADQHHSGRPRESAVEMTKALASSRPTRREVLRKVVEQMSVEETAIFASTGFCGRELYAIADRPNHLYMVGSMGCVATLALGFSLARPDLKVIALDGDGSALMRLGAMATIGAYGRANFNHLLIDNGVHDSTGGQLTVSPSTDFAHIALACGYQSALHTNDVKAVSAWLGRTSAARARFARILSAPGTANGLPRPTVTPPQVRARFMNHFSRSEIDAVA